MASHSRAAATRSWFQAFLTSTPPTFERGDCWRETFLPSETTEQKLAPRKRHSFGCNVAQISAYLAWRSHLQQIFTPPREHKQTARSELDLKQVCADVSVSHGAAVGAFRQKARLCGGSKKFSPPHKRPFQRPPGGAQSCCKHCMSILPS